MNQKPFPQRRISGFSALELLAIVSIIGVVLAIGIPGVTKLTSSFNDVKLDSDLTVLNSAVKSYLSFGGKFEGDESLAVVLTKLKSRASDETTDQVVGLRGTFLDPRYEPVMQTAEEAAINSPRAYWDGSKSKFVLTTSGAAGIKRFQINHDYVAPETELTESRESVVEYAHNSSWIWDYQDAATPSHIQATPIAVSLPPPPGSISILTPGSPTAPLSPPIASLPGDPATVLDPPTFSIPADIYPIADFDLAVSILDPNLDGSTIHYSINSGPWVVYSGGALTIPTGTVLKAQAYPTSSDYLFSSVTQGLYSGATTLLPPVINLSGGGFNSPSGDTVNVRLENPNDETVSKIDYRLNGGPWQSLLFPNLSTTKIQLKSEDYPTGAAIETYAVSTAPEWLNSETVSAFVNPAPPEPDLGFDMSVSTDP